MLNHHPSPEILADYVAGSLPLSHSLCLAVHLEHCVSCRQAASRLSALGAELFTQQPATTTTAQLQSLKNNVLASLDGPPHTLSDSPTTVVREDKQGYRAPKALRQFIRKGYTELEWASLSPSIKVATLLKDKDGAQISLSRVKPGGRMPHHRHTGDELTVVLEGSFSDESGVYSKGDFVCRDKRHKHKPIVTKDAECICLMVLDAPIQFTGWFTRILNPLLRKNHAHA